MPATKSLHPHRREQMTEFFKNCAGDFFARNTSGHSLITVTNVWIDPEIKNADIYISVLPDSKSEAALNFAKRQRTDLQKYFASRVKLVHLPFLEILLDPSPKIYEMLNEINIK